MVISLLSRMGISYLLFHRLLGKRQSLAMGSGLTIKFSLPLVSADAPDPFVSQGQLTEQYKQQVLDHLKRELESLGEINVPVEFYLRVGVPWQEKE